MKLMRYMASGLEPCDYAAMRSALDGEKQAKQSLSEALCALAESNARAEKAERERDAAVSDLETIMAYGGGNLDTCQFCKNGQCYARGGTRLCDPVWVGPREAGHER